MKPHWLFSHLLLTDTHSRTRKHRCTPRTSSPHLCTLSVALEIKVLMSSRYQQMPSWSCHRWPAWSQKRGRLASPFKGTSPVTASPQIPLLSGSLSYIYYLHLDNILIWSDPHPLGVKLQLLPQITTSFWNEQKCWKLGCTARGGIFDPGKMAYVYQLSHCCVSNIITFLGINELASQCFCSISPPGSCTWIDMCLALWVWKVCLRLAQPECTCVRMWCLWSAWGNQAGTACVNTAAVHVKHIYLYDFTGSRGFQEAQRYLFPPQTSEEK